MAANVTTLSAAVALSDTTVLVAAITNVTAGCFLKVDQEMMKVVSVPTAATTPVPVLRGQEGSAQVAHSNSAQVQIGLGPTNLGASDFGRRRPGPRRSVAGSDRPRTRTITNYTAAGRSACRRRARMRSRSSTARPPSR
jgi:hypothetical protein